MNPYNFSLLFFGFCTLFVSFIVRLKRKSKVTTFHLIFSSLAAVWAMFMGVLLSQSTSTEVALLTSRLGNMLAVFMTVLWLHFIFIFTGQEQKQKSLLKKLYLIAFLIDCFGFTPAFIRNVDGAPGFIHWGRAGVIYHAYVVFYSFVIPLGYFHLYKRAKKSKEIESKQIYGFMLACFFGFLGGTVMFFPMYDIMIPQYAIFLMPLYPILMARVMVINRLFDEERFSEALRRDKLASIGTLATSINHEIRNPLYLIQGLADSHIANMEDGIYKTTEQASEKSNEILKKTSKQAKRAMEIMKRFAMFAKQTTTEETKVEKIQLHEVLSEIEPLIKHELDLDKVELIKDIPSELLPFLSDRRHVEQIFVNLIVNSCQAMKANKQKGKIRVAAHQHNGSIRIKVKDNGPGIPEDKMEQVFDPFYTTKQEGTGLGLYVTKQLVEKNGGKIKLKSKVGEGTTFNLEFKR